MLRKQARYAMLIKKANRGIFMKAVQTLPDAYREIYSVNLQKDKKAALTVNILALLIALAMIIPAGFAVPFSSLFNMDKGIWNYFLRFIVILLGSAAYMCLHELIHGLTMKSFGTEKIKYGFTGLYAFAGSSDYYDKKAYITVALAPVIVFLFVFAVINLLVPDEWFWVVYILQVLNISGAAGDIFVTVRFAKMPEDILVQDNGVSMKVYSAQ